MKIDFRAKYLKDDFNNPIDDYMKTYFMRNLEHIVGQLTEGLKIPINARIIIPDNFHEELYKFQLDKGLRQEYTNGPMGIAFAKVLDYMENGGLKTAIFINKALIFSLYCDEYIEAMDEEQKNNIRA